jgi:hypothetical protein
MKHYSIFFILLSTILFIGCLRENKKPLEGFRDLYYQTNVKRLFKDQYDTTEVISSDIKKMISDSKKFVTTDIPQMHGLRMSFNIPSNWQDVPQKNKDVAYHFYSPTPIPVELQIVVTPPSGESSLTDRMIFDLKKQPNILTEHKYDIGRNNAYEITNFKTQQVDGVLIYINVITTFFIYNKQQIAFSFSWVSLNENQSEQINSDLKILYRNMITNLEIN